MTLGTLVTFGYARVGSVDQLRPVLEDVDVVIDVRLNPYSRLPLWGRATARTIAAGGCRYRWEPRLGNVNYQGGGPIQIADIDAIETVLAELRAGTNVALMCVCYAPARCHRRTISTEAVRRLPGLIVRDR